MEAVVSKNVCTGTSGVSYILFFLTESWTIPSWSWYVYSHSSLSHSSANSAFCFTEKKYQYDPDDDSGMGPSIFTDTKSTTFSEVRYSHTYCVQARRKQVKSGKATTAHCNVIPPSKCMLCLKIFEFLTLPEVDFELVLGLLVWA